jgi:DNA-binding response OmpR family regulator
MLTASCAPPWLELDRAAPYLTDAIVRLLLIEDNELLARYVARALRENGFTIDAVSTGGDGEAAMACVTYSAVILDLGLPDVDGLDWLGSLRLRQDQTPVLVLTSRNATPDLVQGLNSGADDYLRKPFEIEELIARTRALLRRPGRSVDALSQGNVSLNANTREVMVDGMTIIIGRRECQVLELMLRRPGRIVPKPAIEEAIYGFGEEFSSNVIEVVVHRLRKRLEEANADVSIHTLRGLGYILSHVRHEQSE